MDVKKWKSSTVKLDRSAVNSHKILHKHIDSHVTVKCDKEIKKKKKDIILISAFFQKKYVILMVKSQ